jgi:hypothetical protein
VEDAPENGKETFHSAHVNGMSGMNISLQNIMDISNCNTKKITISVIE